MAVSDSKFPSSQVFDVIQSTMDSDEALKKKSIKQSQAVVLFKLKNKSGEVQQWWLDLKNDGKVGKGEPPAKADLTLNLSDEHFGQLVQGKANAQKLFMQGKLKVSGAITKAGVLESVLSGARTKAKL